ncbi:MAG: aldose epimerase family protein [Oscillospiraceae bacterium]
MINAEYYGRTLDGKEIYTYTLSNLAGMKVKIIELGCKITHILVPVNGGTRDVVLGYNNIESYEASNCGMGSFIGRYANRIDNACLCLDGEMYNLPANEGANHLHGVLGNMAFKGSILDDTLELDYTSPDGEDGFPGTLNITVSYTLTEQNAFVMDYRATTDKLTVVNFTNHSYFNLDGKGDALSQNLWLASNTFTESDTQNCPTGRILPVKDTPMDFTSPKAIGKDINEPYYQLTQAKGYDHNFILNKDLGELSLAAKAKSSDKSIIMELYTTQPALQLYTANFLGNDGINGKNNAPYADYSAFCLETQHYPCSPSHPEFPSVMLSPSEEYHETTIIKFI